MLAVALVALALQAGPPAISIDDATTIETNFDTVGVLNVTLSAPSPDTVTVHYSMRDGTADSTDYVAETGTLTFAPGDTSAHVGVLVKGDALDEPDETVFVELSGPEHASVAKGQGVLTIVDSDAPRIPVVDATVSARWGVNRTYTRVKQLRVRRAPAAASIEVGCAGGGCPFRFKTSGVNVAPLFAHARLRPGAKIQITVDASGYTGRRFSFRIRAGAAPLQTVALLG